ncbi:MAG: FAD-binding oxidoreductase, partial [Geodermatophilaceae bacterium]|nr:FAD-binding oxidoreductase [Geodermatophilaceae bacterium]
MLATSTRRCASVQASAVNGSVAGSIKIRRGFGEPGYFSLLSPRSRKVRSSRRARTASVWNVSLTAWSPSPLPLTKGTDSIPGVRATVVGSGVVGLTTAITLQRAAWQVRILSAAPIESLTSHLAAAVWFPTHAGPPDAVARWGTRTFAVLAGMCEQPGSGVVMRESLALYRSAPPLPAWAAAVRDLRPATAHELPAAYTYGLRFAVPLVEMPVHLPW